MKLILPVFCQTPESRRKEDAGEHVIYYSDFVINRAVIFCDITVIVNKLDYDPETKSYTGPSMTSIWLPEDNSVVTPVKMRDVEMAIDKLKKGEDVDLWKQWRAEADANTVR